MKGSKKALLIILGFTGVVVLILGVKVAQPQPASYTFITVKHPIDMWQDGKDQWSYYMNEDQSSVVKQAELARPTLIEQGFTEDKSRAPWICFTKGNNEVVICDHGTFAVNGSLRGSKLIQTKSTSSSGRQWPCVLVKNEPGTRTPMWLFQIKKVVHGW